MSHLVLPSSTPTHLLLLPLSQPDAKPRHIAVRPRPAKWGTVDRLAWDPDRALLALAHSTSKLSLLAWPTSGPPTPTPTDTDDGRTTKRPALELVQEYPTTSTVKRANRTVGLAFTPSGLLHATSSGHLSLHPLPSSSPSPSSTHPTEAQTRRLPPNLTCWTTLGAQAQRFAYAGHEVDLSVWDTQRAFEVADQESLPSPTTTTALAGRQGGGKRKKGGKALALLPGEVWRAQNLPNDHLSLRVPIHHLALAPADLGSTTTLYTGTYSGQVRLYDTRASRRPVNVYEVLAQLGGGSGSAGSGVKAGVGALAVCTAGEQGEGEGQGGGRGDVWFAEDGRGQGRVGRMDGRTGRVLYVHSDSSASCAALWASSPSFPPRDGGGGRSGNSSTKAHGQATGGGGGGVVGSLGADGTVRAYDFTGGEPDPKRTTTTAGKGSVRTTAFGAAGGGRSIVGLEADVVRALIGPLEQHEDGARAGGVVVGPPRDGNAHPAAADDEDDEDDDEGIWAALPELNDGERAALSAHDDDDGSEGDEVVVDESEGWSSDEEAEQEQPPPPPKRSKGAAPPAFKGNHPTRVRR